MKSLEINYFDVKYTFRMAHYNLTPCDECKIWLRLGWGLYFL